MEEGTICGTSTHGNDIISSLNWKHAQGLQSWGSKDTLKPGNVYSAGLRFRKYSYETIHWSPSRISDYEGVLLE